MNKLRLTIIAAVIIILLGIAGYVVYQSRQLSDQGQQSQDAGEEQLPEVYVSQGEIYGGDYPWTPTSGITAFDQVYTDGKRNLLTYFTKDIVWRYDAYNKIWISSDSKWNASLEDHFKNGQSNGLTGFYDNAPALGGSKPWETSDGITAFDQLYTDGVRNYLTYFSKDKVWRYDVMAKKWVDNDHKWNNTLSEHFRVGESNGLTGFYTLVPKINNQSPWDTSDGITAFDQFYTEGTRNYLTYFSKNKIWRYDAQNKKWVDNDSKWNVTLEDHFKNGQANGLTGFYDNAPVIGGYKPWTAPDGITGFDQFYTQGSRNLLTYVSKDKIWRYDAQNKKWVDNDSKWNATAENHFKNGQANGLTGFYDGAPNIGGTLATCTTGHKRCVNNSLQTCAESGQWATTEACSADKICTLGGCLTADACEAVFPINPMNHTCDSLVAYDGNDVAYDLVPGRTYRFELKGSVYETPINLSDAKITITTIEATSSTLATFDITEPADENTFSVEYTIPADLQQSIHIRGDVNHAAALGWTSSDACELSMGVLIPFCYENECVTGDDDNCPEGLECQDVNGTNLCVNPEAPEETDCIPPNGCGYTPCTSDDKCTGDLVCVEADNGDRYCSQPEYSDRCAENPSLASCCQPLECSDQGCYSDDDCKGDLKCIEADNGNKYCSMEEFRSRCEDNPSNYNCCEEKILECADNGCQSDSDCSGELVCVTADDGVNYCSMPDYVDACKQFNDYDTCCTAGPPEIPELPRAGSVSPTILFTVGGIVIVLLGLFL